MSKEFNVINELLADFRREIGELDARIARNRRCVREAETYIKNTVDSETDDFKVFSPRKAEIIHKEELEEARERITACEEENESCGRRRELLTGYAEKLENALKCLEQGYVKPAEEEDFRKVTAGKLEDLARRIDLAASCIEKRPLQAKQDLAVIGKCLEEMTKNIKGDRHAGVETG